jgi:hypothetical protein
MKKSVHTPSIARTIARWSSITFFLYTLYNYWRGCDNSEIDSDRKFLFENSRISMF